MSLKTGHVYREQVEFGVYYTYDKDHKKIYDTKEMRMEFQELVKKLKSKKK